MNNPLGVSPSKGNQGATRGEKKYFDFGGNRTHDLRIRSTVTLSTELRDRTEKVGGDLGGKSREEKVRVHMNVVPRSYEHKWCNAPLAKLSKPHGERSCLGSALYVQWT